MTERFTKVKVTYRLTSRLVELRTAYDSFQHRLAVEEGRVIES